MGSRFRDCPLKQIVILPRKGADFEHWGSPTSEAPTQEQAWDEHRALWSWACWSLTAFLRGDAAKLDEVTLSALTIGIDLDVTATCRAVVMAENGRFVTPVICSTVHGWDDKTQTPVAQ